jgi:Domain of unknown function (DUF4760)
MTQDQVSFYGLCAQTGAIVVSAIGVMLVIFWNVRIARRRATLDILLNEQTHETPIAERTEFLKIKKGGDLSKWATAQHSDAPQVETLRSVLNRYELVAIGISGSTLDGKLYKKWCRTTLVNDWIAVKPFVMQLRANNNFPALCCEFEGLAKKWANATERPLV